MIRVVNEKIKSASLFSVNSYNFFNSKLLQAKENKSLIPRSPITINADLFRSGNCSISFTKSVATILMVIIPMNTPVQIR